MAQDWASDLLRALPLPNDVRSTLWEAAYDDDWDTFQQKVKTAVAPKGDRDARVLESKLRQAARRREEYAQRPPPAEPEERGVLGTAADYALTSVIPRVAGWLGAEDPSAYSPGQLAARAGDWVNRAIMGDVSREQTLQAASANEQAVLSAFRRGAATAADVEAAGQALDAARAQPSGARAALAATASTAVMAPGVFAESLTSPAGIMSGGYGAIPATATRTAPVVARNLLGAGVGASTALGVQQTAENARRAFTGGSTEDQILAASEIASTALGLGTMMPSRIGQARVQDVPDVMRQMRAERKTRAATQRNIKADTKNLADINVFAPAGAARAALKQEDMTRLQNLSAEGVSAAGLDLNALPPDVDGFTAWDKALEAVVGNRYQVLRQVGKQLDDAVDLARQNLETAIANDPAPKRRPESLPEWKAWEMARDKATVQLTRDSIRNKLYPLLKETPDAIDEAMFALEQIGNVLDPSAPPMFGPMTTQQALDRITNFINPELAAAGKLDVTTSREYGNRRVSNQAYITGLKLAKQELQAGIVRKAELAGVPNWRELSQDIAVGTKMQNRLLDNQIKKGSLAEGEQLTTAERVVDAIRDAGPVAAGSLAGAGLGSLFSPEGAAYGAGMGGSLAVGLGRFAGRQIAYSGRGNTKADVALKALSRMAEQGEVTLLPRPSVQPGPTAFLQPGAFNYWPREAQIPSREAQIAQALKDGPPELKVNLTSVGKKGAYVHQVVNPITGQPEKKFGGSKVQAAAAQAYANQFRTEDKNYKQLWEMTLRGFGGTDADLADFIQKLRGGSPVVSSPAQSSAVVPPPSPPPSSGGGGTPPLPSRAVGVNPQGTGPAIPPTPPPGMVPATGEITAAPPMSDRQKYWQQQQQLKQEEVARKNAPSPTPPVTSAQSSLPMISRTIDAGTQQLTPMGEFMLRWLAEDVNFRMKSNEGAGYLGEGVDTGKAGAYLADAGRTEGWVKNNDPKWTRSKMADALNTMADTGTVPPSVQQWLKVLEIAWSPEKGAFVADRVSSVDYPPNIKTRDQLKKALPSVMSLSEMPPDSKLAGRLNPLLEPVVEALGMNLAETILGRFVTAPATPPTTLASLAAPEAPPAPAAATLAQVAATPTPAPAVGGPTLPPALAGAKPRYNIGKTSYLPEFANDIDRALFIIAQPTRSKQHNAYLAFLTSATGLSEEALVAAGKELRQFIKTTVSGQPAGQVAIPAFSPTRLGGDAPPF